MSDLKDLCIIREGFELITISLIEILDELHKEYAQVAVGVYTDEAFEQLMGRKPIKPYEERVRLASAIKSIDYVFKAAEVEIGKSARTFGISQKLQSQVEQNNTAQDAVDSNGKGIVSQPHTKTVLVSESQDFESKRSKAIGPLWVDDKTPKQYKIAYVPGTWDLLHEGHLQNLICAKEYAERIVVGVNSDQHVYERKKVYPHDSQEDRMTVIQSIGIVAGVYLVENDDKLLANEWVKEHLGGDIDVIIMGSDLEGQDHQAHGIPIIFTDRDPTFQQTHSSTYMREILATMEGAKEDS